MFMCVNYMETNSHYLIGQTKYLSDFFFKASVTISPN